MAQTNLSQTIRSTNDSGSAYDTNAKYLLADKQILSRILKYTIDEFRNMDEEAIMDCIGDDLEIGTEPVDPGLSSLGRVKGTATEDNVPGEGIIYYDIRFTAYLESGRMHHRHILPDAPKKKMMKILLNIEAQKSTDPGKLGYHLENRIIFYLARMISAQKQTEFFHSDFDNLKKVRSIWICMDSEEKEDSIKEIFLDTKTVFGNKGITYRMDLMKGIIINIRSTKNFCPEETMEKSQNTLISMLEELFSGKSATEKKQILEDEYGMVMNDELEGKIKIMCNLSEAIKDSAFQMGISEGIAKERVSAIKRMIKATITKEQIVSMGYTEAEFAEAENAMYVNAYKTKENR